MVNHCAAPNCRNNSRYNKDLNYHRFPVSRPEILRKWIQAANIKNVNPEECANKRLCSAHFSESSFILRPNRDFKLLNKDAVPDIFDIPQGSSVKWTLELPSPKESCPEKPEIKTDKHENQQHESSDSDLLDILLATVYERRELKKSGAIVSVPNKVQHTRIGELAHVKCWLDSVKFSDLMALHHLIYMTEVNRKRMKKNILDFAGFSFNEESPAYKARLDYLTRLGYDISRRIAFLFGICPYDTLLDQQDLNELIMYFLMSPCQSKEHMSNTSFSNEMLVDFSDSVQKYHEDLSIFPCNKSNTPISSKGNTSPHFTDSENQSSSKNKNKMSPRARKSFKSSFPTSSISKNLSSQRARKSFPLSKTRVPDPSKPTPKPNASPTQVKPDTHPQTPPEQIPPWVFQQLMQSQTFRSSSIKEMIVQRQTANGSLQTLKLIKLPSSSGLNIATSQPASGITVANNNSANNSSVATLDSLVEKYYSSDGSDMSVPVECNYSSDEEEELCTLENSNPPTNEDIYSSIQDILHKCPNLENMTLRIIINRLAAMYPNFDLTLKLNFIKKSVKKIVTAES